MEDYEREPLDSFSLKRSGLVFVLLLLGIAARFLVIAYFEDSPPTDSETLYTQIGESWVERYGLRIAEKPTAAVMPAYPILLGIQKWLHPDSWRPVIWFQILLGSLSAWLIARIAWKAYRQPGAYWAAFLISLFHPAYCAMCGRLEPLCIATFLLVLGTWILTFVFRPSFHLFYFLMAAGTFSLALYCSLKGLIVAPLLALGIGFLAYERVVGILGGITVGLSMLVSLMPWVVRNMIVMGTFIPLTTTLPSQIETALVNRDQPAGNRIRVVAGAGELDDYQRSLGRVPQEIKRIDVKGWIGIVAGTFTGWWSDYPILFEKLHTKAKLMTQVALFTLGIALFCLALIGILPTLNSGRTWVFLLVLGAFGFQVSFLSSPPYHHLFGFPFLIVFAARGVSQISIVFTKSWRSNPPEPPSPKPTWVGENEYVWEDPYLEPIKGPRSTNPDADEDPERKLGPLF